MIEYFLDIKFIISILVIYVIYRNLFGTYKQKLHIKLGCKGPKPLPFFGNMLSVMRVGMHEYDTMCRDKFGKIYPSYFGTIPITVVADEELLKQILIKDFKCFTDRLDIGFKSKSVDKMLTVLKGADWERVRNLITPTFTSGKLKKMSPLLADCVESLSKRLHNSPTGKPIDMKEFFGALTMDAIARTMFGMEINSQTNPNNLFIVNAKKLFSISFRSPLFLISIMFPFVGKLLSKLNPKWGMLGSAHLEFFRTNIQKAIDERKSSTESYNDFLALMLRAGKEDKGAEVDTSVQPDEKYLTSQEILAQSLIFLIAGYETTATTLTYASYLLAKNRDVQQKLYEELMHIIEVEGELSYEALMKMPLLDAAISETLRLFPPAVRFDRTCTRDVDLVTSDRRIIHVKVGDVFTVPVYAIHTDPSIWPDPDLFDISRFTHENKKDRSLYAFMPFGAGPRNCVGMRFALLETKWALASMLRDFEIVPSDQTADKIKFKTFGLSQPDKPILLNVIRRQ